MTTTVPPLRVYSKEAPRCQSEKTLLNILTHRGAGLPLALGRAGRLRLHPGVFLSCRVLAPAADQVPPRRDRRLRRALFGAGANPAIQNPRYQDPTAARNDDS